MDSEHFTYNEEGNYLVARLLSNNHAVEFFDPDPGGKASEIKIKITEWFHRDNKWNDLVRDVPRDEANTIWRFLRDRDHKIIDQHIFKAWIIRNIGTRKKEKTLISALFETPRLEDIIYCPYVPLEKIIEQAAVGALAEFARTNKDHELTKLYHEKLYEISTQLERNK